MCAAKIFHHGGSQAVRLPKAFRLEGSEVLIEKHGDEAVFKPIPVPKFDTFTALARYLAEQFAEAESFPQPPPRPAIHERAIIEL